MVILMSGTSTKSPIPKFTAPPIKHYGSIHGGSPEDQAFARIQARNTKQIAMNNAHKGGGRRRRRQYGGAATPPPPAGGIANDEIVVPQSNTGVHVAGPQNGNSASVVGNTTLAKGTMASQYDNEVEFTPTPGYAGSTQLPKLLTRKEKRSHRHRRLRHRPRHRRRHRRQKADKLEDAAIEAHHYLHMQKCCVIILGCWNQV